MSDQDLRQSTALPIALFAMIGAACVAFLFWLIYVHRASDISGTHLHFLPAVDALLNGLCTAALLTGFYFIRRRNIPAHRISMVIAFIFTTLFFISYVVHHALHGDIRFAGHGAARTAYFVILISHILLSAVALPLILTTFFFALTGRIRQHRAIVRYTLPIWLYVSITGVVVYGMLATWR